MDSPTASTTEGSTARIVTSRSSVIESIRGCGLSGLRVNKEDLKRKLSMPKYLRHAIRDSINSKDVNAAADRYREGNSAGREEAPEGPMVVFVNSKSGGRHGPELKERLQQLMGEEQVFDLSDVRPNEFVEYGLGCLEKLAGLGDFCAKDTRDKLRILVAGGDGTVGWVLGSLTELHRQGREPVPPVAVIPLGTGNDLSRSFGWGGSFPFAWKSAVKRSLLRAITGPVCRLDRNPYSWESHNVGTIVAILWLGDTSLCINFAADVFPDLPLLSTRFLPAVLILSVKTCWHLLMSVPKGEVVDPPHSLKSTDECSLDQGLTIEGELPEKVKCYEGVFYNYFSIGMSICSRVAVNVVHVCACDESLYFAVLSRLLLSLLFVRTGMDAQVAYGFHHLRNEKPYLAQGPISNKKLWKGHPIVLLIEPFMLSSCTYSYDKKLYLIYSGYTCTQGWFLTPCISDPSLRGLKNIIRMHVKKVNCSEWEQIPVPKSVRAIVALNLHSYASGRNPWGSPKPEYLEKKGFVEAHVDDGLLEIFGLKQGWHASFVMVELISAKHIAQAAAIRLEVRGGEWKDAFMQMDGEPWKQPMSKEYSSFVEIKRVPFHSLMVNGD
ncbi:hypothetical protein POTOM_057392 [Populus tomentosa]|uniref:Diacylglycerol kinase n=1 Tax=Populus tomentosa TaxID=118781 RepID=A0A8X8C3E0_POPTO|nr:hypothetical protein POTOM_057392 [Populus tomentosa]